MNPQNNPTLETAILAGGCFWCTEAIFQRLSGVQEVIPGYTGGTIKNPAYREICTGKTGHAEAVQITFDPSRISYTTLLEVFFATHNPTTLNRQGHDVGTQYRSEIFYTTPQQQKQATAWIAQLEKDKVFKAPIVTAISEAVPFYPAEQEHQNYYNTHKRKPYCQFVIHPKLKKLKKHFSHTLHPDT